MSSRIWHRPLQTAHPGEGATGERATFLVRGTMKLPDQNVKLPVFQSGCIR